LSDYFLKDKDIFLDF